MKHFKRSGEGEDVVRGLMGSGARWRRRARMTSFDSVCSNFPMSSRQLKMPFHTRDTSPRCLRFCIAGVSCGMGDRGDAAAAAAAGAGASPSAIGGAKTGTGRI